MCSFEELSLKIGKALPALVSSFSIPIPYGEIANHFYNNVLHLGFAMIRFDGTESFEKPPEEVFAKLSDAGFLIRSLPDSEVIEATPDRGVWKLRPRLSFLSGAIETTLTVSERTPPAQAKYVIVGKGVGASSTVTAVLDFATVDGKTQVNWVGEITALTGLLKLVPKGLISATAKKVIDDVWSAVRKAV